MGLFGQITNRIKIGNRCDADEQPGDTAQRRQTQARIRQILKPCNRGHHRQRENRKSERKETCDKMG